MLLEHRSPIQSLEASKNQDTVLYTETLLILQHEVKHVQYIPCIQRRYQSICAMGNEVSAGWGM